MSKKAVFGIACLVGFISLVVASLADGLFAVIISRAFDRPGIFLFGLFCGLLVYSVGPLAVLLDSRKLIRTRAFVAGLWRSALCSMFFTPVVICLVKFQTETGTSLFLREPKAWNVSEHWFMIVFLFQVILCVGMSGACNPKHYLPKAQTNEEPSKPA